MDSGLRKVLALPYNTKIEMNSNISNILKKIPVKLSLVDDLGHLYFSLDDMIEKTKIAVYDANEQADMIAEEIFQFSGYKGMVEDNEVEAAQDEIKEYVQEFEDKANELGVDPNTLFSDYNKLKDLLGVNINDVINSEKNDNYKKIENL